MPKNRQTLISTKQAAERLREHERTVQRKAESGEYRAQKLPGLRGAYVFREAYIEQLVEQRRLEAEARRAEQAVA
jgi:excisionase family DNA binding protein